MKKTSYNVRVIDNGNGTFSLGFVHRFKPKKGGSGLNSGGEWVDGNTPKVVKLLTKGSLEQ